MRVTDQMVFRQAGAHAGAAKERAQAVSDEVGTGMRVTHPADDPTAAGLIVTHRVAATRFAAIVQTAQRASDELASADGALEGATNALSRARELAVQLSNDSYSANERAAAAAEVDGLLHSVVGLMNRRVGNRYIFGGNLDSTPPFDATGNYVGDTGVRRVELAPGILQDASVRADVVIKGTAGGVDIFASLQALSTALTSGNRAAVAATLNDFDTGISQLAAGRSRVGSSMTVLDAAAEAGRSGRDAEVTEISHLSETDLVDAASRLALAERALDASMTAAARSFKLTLLDKL